MRREIPEGLHARVDHLRLSTADPIDILNTFWPEKRKRRILKYAVGVRHLKANGETVSPRGGVTRVLLCDREGQPHAEGLAVCSTTDNYSKKIGRDIATGRALKALESND